MVLREKKKTRIFWAKSEPNSDHAHHRRGGNNYRCNGLLSQRGTRPRKIAKHKTYERSDCYRECHNMRTSWDNRPCSAAYVRLCLTGIRLILGKLQQFVSGWKMQKLGRSFCVDNLSVICLGGEARTAWALDRVERIECNRRIAAQFMKSYSSSHLL